ncbi:hypothetical protein KJ865_04235, partial [Myxococcota bacterium]|nr:hypothetical protein [Myxococcota bacterium]
MKYPAINPEHLPYALITTDALGIPVSSNEPGKALLVAMEKQPGQSIFPCLAHHEEGGSKALIEALSRNGGWEGKMSVPSDVGSLECQVKISPANPGASHQPEWV